MTTTFARMIQRSDTTTGWAAENPILADGEFGWDTDLKQVKIGNGADAWDVLPWFGLGGGGGATAFFLPEDYGAVGDGVADDKAALQATYDAARDAGGGIVVLTQRYGWTGDLIHRGGITVMGAGKNRFLVTPDGLERGLIALDGTARYRYGHWATANSAGDNPGPLLGLSIDGGNIGGTTQLVLMECVDGAIQDCTIINSAGVALEVGGSQNSEISRCVLGYGSTTKAMSFVTSGSQGAGNIKINSTYFGTSDLLLHLDSDPAQFWPHDIFFNDCLLENYEAGNIALIDAGNVQFTRCVFTNSNASTISNDACVKITQVQWPTVGTAVVFDSCYFNGGANADKPSQGVLVVAAAGGTGNIVRFYGHNNFSNFDACVGVEGTTIANLVSIDGTVYKGNFPVWRAGVGASLLGAFVETSTALKFSMENQATLPNAFITKRAEEAADRFRIDRDGALRWLDGVNNTVTQGSLAYDTVGDELEMGGLWTFSNALSYRPIGYTISAAATAVALSPERTASPCVILNFTTASATANVTLDSGLASGQQFQISIFGNASTNTISWPGNISWVSGPPQPVAGKGIVVNLVWVGSSWYEIRNNDYSTMNTNRVATGQETFSRDLADQLNTAAASQQLSLTYFTAYQSQTITQLRTATGNTAAAATPTLCRMGLYTVADNGDLTLVASTPNDTALWAATTTIYTKALSASYDLIAGQRYAFASLCVNAGAMPTLICRTPSSILGAEAPRLMGQVGGQSDLPASVSAGSVAATNRRVFGEML